MAFDSVQIARVGGAWGAMAAQAGSDGSVTHPHLQRLAKSQEPLRDLADAAHYLCLLHGRHPGVLDHAAEHAQLDGANEWLADSAHAFAGEREWLAKLVSAAGPVPSTPGQAECEAAAAAQRHAIETLAQSDRVGCAAGAAFALVLDWAAIRPVLDTAGLRLGLEPPRSTLPSPEYSMAVVDALSGAMPVERAMLFGAQQMFGQHRALLDLLEARAGARARA